MTYLEVISLIWLTMLSLSLFALYGAVQSKWVSLREKLDDLKLAEHLHRIMERLDSDTVRRNAQLKAALQHAAEHIEGNKHLADKYWHELRAIKELL